MDVIERYFDKPTIYNKNVEVGLKVENDMLGTGTMIVDDLFFEAMKNISTKLEGIDNLGILANKMYQEIRSYFTSSDKNELDRRKTYSNNLEIGADGIIEGVKLSSLKGKNIAMCSEKSIAAYLILNNLYQNNFIKRKPSFMMSYLQTSTKESKEPHAFVLLDDFENDNNFKHILFDVENLTLLENDKGEKFYQPGLYIIDDSNYDLFLNGKQIDVKSVYESNNKYREISPKRLYGNDELFEKTY